MIKASCDGEIEFFISENKKNKCIYTELKKSKIKKVGIFAKSWEYADAQILYKIEFQKGGNV